MFNDTFLKEVFRTFGYTMMKEEASIVINEPKTVIIQNGGSNGNIPTDTPPDDIQNMNNNGGSVPVNIPSNGVEDNQFYEDEDNGNPPFDPSMLDNFEGYQEPNQSGGEPQQIGEVPPSSIPLNISPDQLPPDQPQGPPTPDMGPGGPPPDTGTLPPGPLPVNMSPPGPPMGPPPDMGPVGPPMGPPPDMGPDGPPPDMGQPPAGLPMGPPLDMGQPPMDNPLGPPNIPGAPPILPITPPTDIGKLELLKNIQTKLLELNKILESYSDNGFSYPKKKVSEAIDLFNIMVMNFPTFKDKALELSEKYRKFIEAVIDEIRIIKDKLDLNNGE